MLKKKVIFQLVACTYRDEIYLLKVL